MTEEELKFQLKNICKDIAEQGYGQKRGYDVVDEFADQILTLIREAGWKSPEEVMTILISLNEGLSKWVDHVCLYSRAMNQHHERECIICGKKEK